MKKEVLFISVHNSARSQIAEELLKKLGGDQFEVESSGFDPTEINPLVIKIMKEEAIDLSQKKTQNLFSIYEEEKSFRYVVTVCNKALEIECPVFLGYPMKIHWDLENPEYFTGTDEENFKKLRELKNQIKMLVKKFIKEYGS